MGDPIPAVARVPAAQYVRMSDEAQRYSINNQKAERALAIMRVDGCDVLLPKSFHLLGEFPELRGWLSD